MEYLQGISEVKSYNLLGKQAEKLNNELPDYQYDESGAIREWAMKEYQENNAHRHISHLLLCVAGISDTA